MSEPDKSREKSLYHLLLTVIRKLNAPTRPQKKEISNQLKTLTVVKGEGKFKISIENGQIVKQVEILVSDVKFYDTKNDPNVGKKNLQKAHEIALELFPALALDRNPKKKNKQIEKSDIIFIAYVLGLITFSFSQEKIIVAILVGISVSFTPFWNLASNFNVISRWLGSLTFLIAYIFVSYKDSELNNSAELLIGINLACYFLSYTRFNTEKKWPMYLIIFSFFPLLFNEYFFISAFAITFFMVEIFLRKFFRRGKIFGFYIFTIFILGLFLFLLYEIFETNSASIFTISQILAFLPLFYSYLVGASQSGSIRLATPIFATLCMFPSKSIIYLVMGFFLFFVFRRISNFIDWYNHAK
jgi:hypothetical protein